MRKYLIILIGLFLFIQPVYAETESDYSTSDNNQPVENNKNIDDDTIFDVSSYTHIRLPHNVYLYPFIFIVVVVTSLLERKGTKLGDKTISTIKAEENKIEDSLLNEEHKNTHKNNTNYNKVINKYLKGYNEKRLLDDLYEIFVIIEKAYMNFEYEILEEYCSNELYEDYKMNLDELKQENCRNIVSNFKLKSKSIRNIEEKNNRVEIDAFIEISFCDYIVNEKTGDIVFGKKDENVTNCYDLEYIIDLQGPDKCPNCGAELTSRRCSYCNSMVDKKNTSLVLNKKSIMHK